MYFSETILNLNILVVSEVSFFFFTMMFILFKAQETLEVENYSVRRTDYEDKVFKEKENCRLHI